MPIQRIPVKHKFGIVSVTHKKELEKRVQEKAQIETEKNAKISAPEEQDTRYHVTEDFVHQFNTGGETERPRLEKEARVYLNRVKRKIGLKNAGVGDHVDLSEGWKELMLLAVCEARALQEEALETLYVSLYYAPVSRRHVDSLLDLGRHCVEWIRERGLAQPFLRTGEIKLLKVTHLIFLRIYYHHMADDLRNLEEKKMELSDAVQAFVGEFSVYRPFPSVTLSMAFISAVGNCLSNDWPSQSVAPNLSQDIQQERKVLDSIAEDGIPVLGIRSGLKREFENGAGMVESTLYGDQNTTSNQDFSAFLDARLLSYPICTPSFLEQECPFLMLALKLWRSVSHTRKGINVAMKDLMNCQQESRTSNWIYGILGIMVFAEAAAINDAVMPAFQTYACDRIPFSKQDDSKWHSLYEVDTQPRPKQQIDTEVRQYLESNKSDESFIASLTQFMSLESMDQGNTLAVASKEMDGRSTPSNTMADSSKQKKSYPTQRMKTITRGHADADAVSWNLYQILVYVRCLGRICTRGKSSNIRRMALLGGENPSYGLLHLLYFQLQSDLRESPHVDDFSWQIRHMVVLELVKIVEWFRDDLLNEGIKSASWNALLKHKTQEKDNRVLEAVKISRVEAEIENTQLRAHPQDCQSLFSRLSTNMAIIFLPPLHPLPDPVTPAPIKTAKKSINKKTEAKTDRQPHITISENIMLGKAIPPTTKSMQTEVWNQVQQVAAKQFEKEVLEDESKRQLERERTTNQQIEEVNTKLPRKPLRQRLK